MTNRREIFERVLPLERGRTALLVVDMQRGFLDPGEALEVPRAREIVPTIRRLRTSSGPRACRSSSRASPSSSAICTPSTSRPDPARPPGLACPRQTAWKGTPSADTVPALAPRPGELVVRKHGDDAFAGTPLDSALRARGVSSLVVTGTLTDICVLATVTAALHREYRISVVEDGVATLWPETQRATLDIIGRAYGRVVSSKEIADQISAW